MSFSLVLTVSNVLFILFEKQIIYFIGNVLWFIVCIRLNFIKRKKQIVQASLDCLKSVFSFKICSSYLSQSNCKPRHNVTIRDWDETLLSRPVDSPRSFRVLGFLARGGGGGGGVSRAATLQWKLIDCSESKVSPMSWEFPLTRHG